MLRCASHAEAASMASVNPKFTTSRMVEAAACAGGRPV
jgi:hypothetical protein